MAASSNAENSSKAGILRIYLDHAATAPLLAQAQAAMLPWLDVGNPSSLHLEGRRAKAAIDSAREILSSTLGCLFAECLFTSSGTEAAALALVGAALGNEDPRRNRILMSAAEHHCVLHSEPLLRRLGYTVELIPVDGQARVVPEVVEELLAEDVLLASVMHANNEFGTLNDIPVVSSLVHNAGALLHVDAVQTFRSVPWKVDDLEADLISMSGHKIGGPKGVGAIYIRAGTRVKAITSGGGQEREMRGGTENVAAIAGFAAAAQVERADSSATRDLFESTLVKGCAVASVSDATRLPGHCHVRFPGVDAETMLISLDRAGISASSGAACSSGSVEPSHVMRACGYSEAEAKEGLRFTFGPSTSEADAREAASRVLQVADHIIRNKKAS